MTSEKYLPMAGSPVRAGEPFTDAETRRILAQFQQDGYFDFGPVLEADEVEILGADLQRKWDDPNQMWHRGAPNASDRTRLMAGVTYSKRFVAQKFHPFIDYRMPEHVWDGASPRLQRLLGRHEKGAYG